MPLPEELTREEEGKLEVNKQYQEVMKIAINLVTASLVLPVVFRKNILGLEPEELEDLLNPWKTHQAWLAYFAWVCLLLSLLCCVLFYFWSTKFTKAVYGIYKDQTAEHLMEGRRDAAGWVAGGFAFVGVVVLLIFFLVSYSTTAVPCKPTGS